MSETTLWTNSNTSSSFAAQTVSLNSSMLNYDYLKFVFQSTTSSTDDHIVLVPTSNFYGSRMQSITSNAIGLTASSSGTSTNYCNRWVSNTQSNSSGSTTSVFFGNSIRQDGTASNTTCIPKKIIGMK